MNLYLLTSDTYGYSVFESCVVAAINEEAAKLIHPYTGLDTPTSIFDIKSWDFKTVKAKFIGTTDIYDHGSVVLASFNVG